VRVVTSYLPVDTHGGAQRCMSVGHSLFVWGNLHFSLALALEIDLDDFGWDDADSEAVPREDGHYFFSR
jgi:hypothetical protein